MKCQDLDSDHVSVACLDTFFGWPRELFPGTSFEAYEGICLAARGILFSCANYMQSNDNSRSSGRCCSMHLQINNTSLPSQSSLLEYHL